MQDYISLAGKNGVALLDKGDCQFCGAKTKRGIHECVEIFNLGFQEIDFSSPENHIYRFLIVDAHTLQHPEIHGRWSNHYHLSRLHLIHKHQTNWTYKLSPKLSNYLNKYKQDKKDEYLESPERLKRGRLTTTDIKALSSDELECKKLIRKWAQEVYESWEACHHVADRIAREFLDQSY